MRYYFVLKKYWYKMTQCKIADLPSMKIALNPLTSSVLLPSGLSEGMPATDEAIKKKNVMDQIAQH